MKLGGDPARHRRGRRSEGTIIKIRSRLPGALIVAASVWVLCACSMSTSIQRDALDYNAGVANYNDQMLMYTILRARDDAPTRRIASLNTQGFTLGIIQPISPMYIVSKWSTGLDREFLLRLFIKSINLKEATGYHEYLNDPNSPAVMAAFSAKPHTWFPGISMRALTVLEPLGPPLG